jgi:transketolase
MTYEEALAQIVLADERYVVLTAENRAAIRTLPARLGARFIDVGIAEQALVAAAAGLALRGRVPIVHALAAFLTMRAFEFIRTDVGVAHLPVKLVGGVPGVLSEANGPTHQALEDVALMRNVPRMGVFCPADEQDLALGLPEVLASDRPFYIRHNGLQAVVEHERGLPIGQAEVIFNGHDVAILVYGALFRQAHEAANLLEMEELSVRLVNLRMLKPVDEAAILSAARQTRLLVLVEDHWAVGGLVSIVAELLMRQQMTARVLPINLAEGWFQPARLPDVMKAEGLTGAQIAQRVIDELARRPS